MNEGQFPTSQSDLKTMREILDEMKPHFKWGAHEPSQRIKPPANKKQLIQKQPEYNVTPEYKKIFIHPKPKKIEVEIETTICMYCDSDTVNGHYCDDVCERLDRMARKQSA